MRTRITKSRPKSLEATDVLAPRIIKSIAGSALRTRENDVRKNALLQAVGRLVLVGRLAFMVAPLVAGGVRRHSQVAAVPSNLGSCPWGLKRYQQTRQFTSSPSVAISAPAKSPSLRKERDRLGHPS